MNYQLNVGSLTTDDDHNGASVYWDSDGGLFWCDHCGKYIAFTKEKTMAGKKVKVPPSKAAARARRKAGK